MRSLLAASIFALPLAVSAAGQRTAVLDVQNMTCSVCPVTVRKALQRVAGVADAKVDVEKKTAIVTFDPDRTTPAALVNATTTAGFPQHDPDTAARIGDYRLIIAFRNVLIHGHDLVDHALVWSTIETQLPRLLRDDETLLDANA